jgi:hypothetical protein
MTFHVFLFLPLLSLVWLDRLYMLHHVLAHWRAGTLHPVVHRLLKPRTPRDYPSCCLSSTFSPGARSKAGEEHPKA